MHLREDESSIRDVSYYWQAKDERKMTTIVNIEFSAKNAGRAVRRGDLLIVIDALRCSSSIVTALANGAKAVIPVRTLKEAYALRERHKEYLLAGERGGIKPKGFDIGNSPSEFIWQRVNGRILILSTTSGTVALIGAKEARWVLIGAFLNAGTVASKALEIAEKEGINITLLLSGRKGLFSLEDFLCGGAVIERFKDEKVDLADAALAALLSFKSSRANLVESVLRSEHARSLVKLGFRKDVEFSCQLDLYNIVPLYREGIIRLLPQSTNPARHKNSLGNI